MDTHRQFLARNPWYDLAAFDARPPGGTHCDNRALLHRHQIGKCCHRHQRQRQCAGIWQDSDPQQFFPDFLAGPIEDQSTFDKSKFQKDLTRDDLVFGVYRMLEGFILSYFIGQNIILAALDQYTQTAYVDPDVVGFSVIVVILLKFLYLYINFTGYTSFAIGLAAFFGLRVRENFRYPFLARNPEEFWSRWHMSLGQFISKYLYFRMLVILKRPQLALFLAFVIVGLWHSIGLQYLLWGVGHGAYLVLFLAVKRRYAKSFTVLPAPIKFSWASRAGPSRCSGFPSCHSWQMRRTSRPSVRSWRGCSEMSEPDQKTTRVSKAWSLFGKLLVIFMIAFSAAYFISHFPFGRVEYIYQEY